MRKNTKGFNCKISLKNILSIHKEIYRTIIKNFKRGMSQV